MYHPYQKCNKHPFSTYRACGKQSKKFNNNVHRDDPRIRRGHRYTTGLHNLDSYVGDELHPYCSFVEGFTVTGVSPTTTAEGSRLVPLWKQDFQPLQNGGLALYNPRFVNKTAFVIFVVNYCLDCQDTKQMWQAYAIEAHDLIGGGGTVSDCIGATIGSTSKVCTKRIQSLMYKRHDGTLVEYAGQLNVHRLKQLLQRACILQNK